MISNVIRFVIGLLTFSLVQAQETQGTPGVDYPNFATIPKSSFKCSDQEFIPGFYADSESQCQAYHYCSEEGQETFLCPIGSIFNQAKLACDAWHNTNCTLASQFYSSNSGFLLDSAIKNVPLLIKLRNRAQNRFPFRVSASNVYEKITSLYDGAELDQSSTEGSSVSKVNAEQNQDTNEESQGEQLNEDESLDDILSRLEESIQNDEPGDGMYNEDNDDGNGGASDSMQTNLFFDPVTEQYYMNPESSQNEWSRNFGDDQFAYYNHENFAYKYGLAMQDAEESVDLVESTRDPIDLYGLNEMNNEEAEDAKFLKRQLDIEQPFRRLRRKPIYTVIREDYDGAKPSIAMTDEMYSVMDSEDGFSTESVSIVTDVNSQPSDEITTENEGVTYTMAPFEITEDVSRAQMTPLSITEVPMTSEEFEDAIISELIVPKIDEHDLRVLGSTSDQEQPNAGYADDTSSDVQNDGYYRYVENESPEQFEYSNVYDAERDAENLETESEMSDEIDDTAEYQNDGTAEDSGKSDDTFVVIPDESEISQFSEAFDSSANSAESTFQDLSDKNVNENDAARDSMDFNIPTNYVSQGVYSVADPSQYRTSRHSSVEYGPGQYFQEGYFNPENEESSSPYDYADDAQATGSELHQYGFEAHGPTNQYMYASPASYVCQQQVGYANCMYGPQSGYQYAGYYDNPYVSNFPFGVSDVEESSESPLSHVDGSYSSESPMSYMIQSDPNMNNEKFEINPDYEHPNSYQDRNLEASDYPKESPLDNSGTVLNDESVDQEETYYVFDDDETTSEVDPEAVSEPSSHDNIGAVMSDVTGNEGETYYILDDEGGKVMEDDHEVETFSDVSENEEVHQKQTISQEKPLHLEEQSLEDSVDVVPSQTTDSKDVSQSGENSPLDNTESLFVSAMDSRFTHTTNGGSFTAESDRDEKVLLDSSELLGRNDETSTVFSRHGNLPNMFLNNMAYSDPINFGPHGFGSSLGQPMKGGSPAAFSLANGLKRSGDSQSPNVSKLSALQQRIRSLKQGKFGAFKKYVSSSGSKNKF